MIALPIKMRLKIYAKVIFDHVFNVLALTIDQFFYLMLLVDFRNVKTGLIKKSM